MSLAIIDQPKLAGIALAAGLGFALAFPLAANAASDAQICAAQGESCTFDKVGGVSMCNCVEEPPNQPNPGGVQKTEETSQKGSTKSSHEPTDEDCVNNSGGEHCR
jgi:hypothetical protein